MAKRPVKAAKKRPAKRKATKPPTFELDAELVAHEIRGSAKAYPTATGAFLDDFYDAMDFALLRWPSMKMKHLDVGRKIVSWVFDTAKYAFLVGAIKYASKATDEPILSAFTIAAIIALFVHVQIGSITLVTYISNWTNERLNRWVYLVSTYALSFALSWVLTMSANSLADQALKASHP